MLDLSYISLQTFSISKQFSIDLNAMHERVLFPGDEHPVPDLKTPASYTSYISTDNEIITL